MDYHKTGYKFLIWIMFVLYLICNTSLVDGIRFYRSYRTYYTYYYYYSYGSYTLSTGAIVGIVFGALIGGAIFCTGCVLCCICICGNSKKNTSGQVITTNQPTVSTITTSQMNSNAVNYEPPVCYSSSTQYPQGSQYNTEYSAPPPTYNDATDRGMVNFGFRNPT